jgi:hypothetical protein
MKLEKENRAGGSRPVHTKKKKQSPTRINSKNSPLEQTSLAAYLLHRRFGLSRLRARLIAELAGLGGAS